MRFNRDRDEFYNICLNWEHTPYAFYKNEDFIGYLITDGKHEEIYEVVGTNEEMEIIMIQKIIMEVPPEAELIHSWCPLPLYVSSQDFA